MSEYFLLIPVFLPLVLGAVSYFIPFRAPGHRNAYVMVSLLISAAGDHPAHPAVHRPVVFFSASGRRGTAVLLSIGHPVAPDGAVRL